MNVYLYRLAPTLGLITAATLALLILVLITIVSPPALAQSSIRTLTTGDETLEIEINKGILVRLPRPASAVFVANPGFADIAVKSPTLVYVMGKRTGITTLFAVDDRDAVLADVNLVVTHNLTDIRASIDVLLPDARVEARSVPGGLLLTGLVNSAREAEEARRIGTRFLAEKETLINQILVVGPNQVNLRVRIAEVSRTVLKNLGFNFDFLGTIGNFAFGLATGRPFLTGIGTAAGLVDSSGVLSGSFGGRNFDANGIIDALEDEGLITLLAEPNLTALSGETASFLAGGEFPIPIVDEDGNIHIEFKTFGVSLAFTPTIVSDDRISLKVMPEVSALSSAGAVQINGIVIPALTTRRANTTVELGSGQSFVIAGLLQADTNQSVNETPGLANIPILGALFRSTDFRRSESELVIIVTPYLVRPVSSAALALPTDGFEVPDDYDRIVNGETRRQKQTPTQRTPQTSDFDGPTGPGGFELE
ncbi:MAG: type II and III secretion system protein family protein [Alphaproteobacteria bacterium]|nr:type II and III secretion system protein family protein [Alphaproteobacteria bacterium]